MRQLKIKINERNHDFQVQCKLNPVKSMEDRLELDHPYTAESLGNRRHSCATRAPYSCSLCLLGPTDFAAPPTSQQIHPFLPIRVKYRHRHAVFNVFLKSTIYLSHPQESSYVPTNQTQGSPNSTNTPRACRAKLFCCPQTRFAVVCANCPNPVRDVKVCPVKNELHSRSYF